MSRSSSSQSHPNDWQSDIPLSKEENEKQSFPFFGPSFSSCPIDESGDFYDPFSDLNLFLSQKIKSEMERIGSPSNWSAIIESQLLHNILPEFKKKFPKYRLGKTALKKIWEKVAYYYDKIHREKGAVTKTGKLHLPFLVKENLKSIHALPTDLPPYSHAQQIAITIAECSATLDGDYLSIDYLTKLIWGVQKHLLNNLIAIKAKPPFKEYDKIDKIIVKSLLETLSLYPHLSLKEVKKKISNIFSYFAKAKELAGKSQLTSTLSMVLAKKLQAKSNISSLSFSEKRAIESFIHCQIKLSTENKILLSADTHCIELIQRILSLYAIAMHIPRNIDYPTLRSAIRYVSSLVKEETFTSSAGMESALFVFIHAEMHLINDQKQFNSMETVENQIIEAYTKAIALPSLSPKQYEQVEKLSWKAIAEGTKDLDLLPPPFLSFLEKELANTLMDNPEQTFRQVISHTIQFFKEIPPLFSLEEETSLKKNIKEKIDIWAVQNDMLCRFIHLDEQNPLFVLALHNWHTGLKTPFTPSDSLIDQTIESIKERYPILQLFPKQLKMRLWILSKYFWYVKLSNPGESSYVLFRKWHKMLLKQKYPQLEEKELANKLKKYIEKTTPFFPC